MRESMKSIYRFYRKEVVTCDDYAEAAQAGRLMLGQYVYIHELEKTVRFLGTLGGNIMTLYTHKADPGAQRLLKSRALELSRYNRTRKAIAGS
ncbi:hypothetical protein [Pannonibacter sp. SL95]|uniref:hypothetical protein n=1 Tax=Pannonibacter sp. SL95 TaxID=2995153 RepID=UPI002276C323|nr:hypothetical protein [Pannonibacter sp. SL95]MCY1705268.1 hypothetical protein [Pannonibacter sp. SL95]